MSGHENSIKSKKWQILKIWKFRFWFLISVAFLLVWIPSGRRERQGFLLVSQGCIYMILIFSGEEGCSLHVLTRGATREGAAAPSHSNLKGAPPLPLQNGKKEWRISILKKKHQHFSLVLRASFLKKFLTIFSFST